MAQTTAKIKEAQFALSKAKLELFKRPDSVFFTHLTLSLGYVWDEHIPTACTNGLRVKINPNYFMGLHPEERIFLVLHEVLHCAYMHMLRRSERDHNRWNIAADYVINNHLIERGFRCKDSWYFDPQYSGMSTEKVYDLLPENTPPPPDGAKDLEEPGDEPSNGAGSGNEVVDPKGIMNSEKIEKTLTEIIQNAALQSKMAKDAPGVIPGDIQIFLDRLLKPKLAWNVILRKWFNQFAKNDYTFKRPNRRFLPKHILPSLYSENLGNIAIFVDTSGSVTDKEFLRFVSEIHCILRMLRPDKITLGQFDRQIRSIAEVRSTRELMKVHFTGRGGTSITPVMEWAQENKPQALLVFTDGDFRIHADLPQMPNTVWMIHNNPNWKAPFGKAIHYETEVG